MASFFTTPPQAADWNVAFRSFEQSFLWYDDYIPDSQSDIVREINARKEIVVVEDENRFGAVNLPPKSGCALLQQRG